jgi:hypothetical protein
MPLGDHITRAGDALSHSPSRSREPSRDLQPIRPVAERPLQLGDPSALLGLQRTRLPRLEPLRCRLQRLVAPPAQQALGNLMLVAQLGFEQSPRSEPTTISRFSFALKFRCFAHLVSSLVEPPTLAQPLGCPSGDYAPPGLSDAPTQLPVNAGPGSRHSPGLHAKSIRLAAVCADESSEERTLSYDSILSKNFNERSTNSFSVSLRATVSLSRRPGRCETT